MKSFNEIAQIIVRNRKLFDVNVDILDMIRNMKNLCGEFSEEEKQNLADYLKIYIGRIYMQLGSANEILQSEAIGKEFSRIMRIMDFVECYLRTPKKEIKND